MTFNFTCEVHLLKEYLSKVQILNSPKPYLVICSLIFIKFISTERAFKVT